MWEWAIENVAQDHKERSELLSSLYENLTWWLQPELKSKQNSMSSSTAVWPEAKEYIEDLHKNGASEEYVQKEVERMQRQSSENSDLETAEVLRGPNE